MFTHLFDRDLGFTVFKFRYLECQEGYTYRAHEHDHIEVNYVKKGSCSMHFGDTIVQFHQGDTMVVYPGSNHYFCTDSRLGCTLVQLEFRINNLSVLEFKENPDENLLFLYSLLKKTHRFLKVPGNQSISDNMERLVNQLDEARDQSDFLIKLYFYELLIHLGRQLKQERDLVLSRTDKHVIAALQYLHNNFLEDPSVEDIAAYCGISSRYLRNLFFEQTGSQMVDYKHNLRMKLAIELLRNPDNRITDIAYRCGYNTQQYFCKVFKDYYGVSPKNYHIPDRL